MEHAISRRAFVTTTAVAATAVVGLGTGCSGDGGTGSSNKAKSASKKKGSSSVSKAAVARPSTCGRLQVAGTALVDKNENPVQLKGFSTHGLSWFPQYVNAACFSELAGWGANLARLAVYTDENGGWCTDGDRDALRDLIDDGVSFAKKADMYVIIDWHVLHDQNPNAYLAEAKDFWDEMSRRYAARTHVIYEICNEPNGATTWAEVKDYAKTIIPIIRANDPHAPILVGTPTWSQDVDQAAADPLQGCDNVMYTLHFYAATHKNELRQRLRESVDAGLPVFASEYGICDASGNGELDLSSAQAWMDLLDELGVSSACWNLSNKDESSSLIASTCDKTSGFDDADLSESGRRFRAMLQGETSGTEASSKKKKDSSKTGTNESSADLPSVSTSSGISCTPTVRQAWESDGKQVRLFDLKVENTGSVQASTWSVDLTFDSAVTVTDSWNATVSQSGQTVHLEPAEYNATIAAGSRLSDVGLIVQIG